MFDKGHTRSLAALNRIFGGERRLEDAITGLLSGGRAIQVAEVGIGHGRPLMELAWGFRSRPASFHGVTLKRAAPLESREDLRRIAEAFGIVRVGDAPDLELPQVYFYDARSLHFEDESLDLVYSAVTVRFMDKKAEFIEEVARVLRPGGRAFLDLGERNWEYPYSVAADDRILTPYTSRFVLKYGDELIPLRDYVRLFEGDSYRLRFLEDADSKCVLDMTKLRSACLSLSLSFNPELSMSGYEVPLVNKAGDVRGGIRSVYELRPEPYLALFAQGVLSRDQLRTDDIALLATGVVPTGSVSQ